MQGERTDAEAVRTLRNAIRAHEECHLSLVNYRKSGSSFLNLLSISPIFDNSGLCRFYVGTLTEVRAAAAAAAAADSVAVAVSCAVAVVVVVADVAASPIPRALTRSGVRYIRDDEAAAAQRRPAAQVPPADPYLYSYCTARDSSEPAAK